MYSGDPLPWENSRTLVAPDRTKLFAHPPPPKSAFWTLPHQSCSLLIWTRPAREGGTTDGTDSSIRDCATSHVWTLPGSGHCSPVWGEQGPRFTAPGSRLNCGPVRTLKPRVQSQRQSDSLLEKPSPSRSRLCTEVGSQGKTGPQRHLWFNHWPSTPRFTWASLTQPLVLQAPQAGTSESLPPHPNSQPGSSRLHLAPPLPHHRRVSIHHV